jgi:predicted amidophosphoribosyltransferase
MCANCREKIENTFDTCWKCGTPRKKGKSKEIKEFKSMKQETSTTLKTINTHKRQRNKDYRGFFATEKRMIKKGVSGGIIIMTIAVIWFFAGKAAGYIFYYPPILFCIGLFAFFRGLVKGNLIGDKKAEKEITCNECGAEGSAEATVCPQCGTDLTLFECTNCGRTLSENDVKCPDCGEDVSEIKETKEYAEKQSEEFDNMDELQSTLPCWECTHYDSKSNVCSHFHFNVQAYPKRYDRKCKGVYFSQQA